jgi:small subunit ribosomal protein S21
LQGITTTTFITITTNSTSPFHIQKQLLTFAVPERRYLGIMIIINVKDGESLDKALKRFKKKFEKTGVLRELRSRQAFEKKSITRRHEIKHAIYKQNMNLEPTV